MKKAIFFLSMVIFCSIVTYAQNTVVQAVDIFKPTQTVTTVSSKIASTGGTIINDKTAAACVTVSCCSFGIFSVSIVSAKICIKNIHWGSSTLAVSKDALKLRTASRLISVLFTMKNPSDANSTATLTQPLTLDYATGQSFTLMPGKYTLVDGVFSFMASSQNSVSIP